MVHSRAGRRLVARVRLIIPAGSFLVVLVVGVDADRYYLRLRVELIHPVLILIKAELSVAQLRRTHGVVLRLRGVACALILDSTSNLGHVGDGPRLVAALSSF